MTNSIQERSPIYVSQASMKNQRNDYSQKYERAHTIRPANDNGQFNQDIHNPDSKQKDKNNILITTQKFSLQ